jgi:hypothetical protein
MLQSEIPLPDFEAIVGIIEGSIGHYRWTANGLAAKGFTKFRKSGN